MPCRYDPSPSEIEAANQQAAQKRKKLEDDLDRLTHENDMLREEVLRVIDAGFEIDPAVAKLVSVNQIKHRKEDLKRLKVTFTELIRTGKNSIEDFERLGRVVTADPTQPLKPQLGFDPDEF